MNIYAIGDLHLPGGQEKPMDVFGSAWKDHPERIAENWKRLVRPDDLVLVPGDLSWAMKLDEVRDDLNYLGQLPGTIVIIRGNHDYWWHGIGKVRQALPPNVFALQNDFIPLGDGGAICGTRGWDLPEEGASTLEDERIVDRELQRLELSLTSATKSGLQPLIVMLHFPPAFRYLPKTPWTDLLERYQVRVCVYGHLHGEGRKKALVGNHRGIDYHLVACDAIDFTPVLIGHVDQGRLIVHGNSG